MVRRIPAKRKYAMGGLVCAMYSHRRTALWDVARAINHWVVLAGRKLHAGDLPIPVLAPGKGNHFEIAVRIVIPKSRRSAVV
jgi:hypothetical protein